MSREPSPRAVAVTRRFWPVLGIAILAACTQINASRPPHVAHAATIDSPGSLAAVDPDGRPSTVCPLKHTAVRAEISGPLVRVNVTQEFQNPLSEAIEAVYTFPLPQRAAVDDMTILVGDRTVRGKIKRREEARKIYEDARRKGQLTGLLDQERPNIFTQSVANIGPGMTVKVSISYVEALPYEAGKYEFSFPMVVGPRYIPGSATGQQGGGWAPDTDRVPDASKVTPPVTPPGTRAGHDISIEVKLDAGVPVHNLASKTHEVETGRLSANRAMVRLKQRAVLPNKDFILAYEVAGRKVEDALLSHRDANSGYFTFLLQPPDRVSPSEATPKEIVFVLDTSGSMSGFPLEKSKEVIKLAMDNLNPRDTFNLITFAGDTHILFDQPVPATPENVRRAQQFLLSRRGGGGTEMMKAIRAALEPTNSQEHVRIVCFLTDGYIGNDFEIVGEVKRYANARVFSFGIGSSVNRFLLDRMAEEGRGEVEYVALNDDGSAAAKRFHERVHAPLLTDVAIDWNGLPVADVYPKRIPDLFAAKPLVITGRYGTPARGTIRLRGRQQGREFVREIPVNLPATEKNHTVLGTLWARAKVDDLMRQDWNGLQRGSMNDSVKENIVEVALQHRLMTQFTSFVAVEEKTVTEGGRLRRVEVPVEMPEGVSYEGVFGDREPPMMPMAATAPMGNMSRKMTFIGSEVDARRGAGQSQPPVQVIRPGHPPVMRDAASKIDGQLAAAAANGGTLNVKVWLSDASPAVLAELKKAGLQVVRHPNGAKLVFGRVDSAKLPALAALVPVLYISLDLGQP